MEFTCEEDYSSKLKTQLAFMDLLRNKRINSSHFLFPYISQEFNSYTKSKICLLCNRLIEAMDLECTVCQADMLVFLEILHDSANWIPMGWQQYMSHSIPTTPDLTRVHFNINTNTRPSEILFDIRNHLALCFANCANQKHIASLEILCIRNICCYMCPPCPDINHFAFINNLKKIPNVSQQLTRIFNNMFDLFENSFFYICPPGHHLWSRFHFNNKKYGYNVMFDLNK